MESALKHIEFLANSGHRVEILRALDEEPHDPRDLQTETEASRSTVGRVLKELENREWIERNESGYETTLLGALIVDEFESLLETMNRVEVLEEAVQWLPVEEMSIDLYELGDGELIYPSEKNLSSHIEHGNKLIQESERVLIFANEMIPVLLEVIWDRVVGGHATSAHVYADSVMETILEHERMSDQVRDIIDAGDLVYRYDGTIPFDMIVLDRTVLLYLCTEAYLPEALLVTENEAVLTWAESTFDSYRNRSTPLEREASV